MRHVLAAGLLCGVVLLSGCANDPLAEQWGSGKDTGYIAGDGSVTEVPLEQRGAPVEFSGVAETGETITQDAVRGEVAVLNFWYAGCAPCRAEAPDLQRLNEAFAEQGVVFLGVNTRDGAAQATQFATEFGVTYPSILDSAGDRSVQRAFAASIPLNAVPTTLVLDRQGRVAARILGQLADESILRTLIADTLEEA